MKKYKKLSDLFNKKIQDVINLNDFDALFEELNNKTYKLSDISISTRVVSHWRSKGLLLHNETKVSKNSMVKFSLFDIVWLKAIESLRKYGIPIKKIRNLKTILCDKELLNLQNKDLEVLEMMIRSESTDEDSIQKFMSEIRHKGLKAMQDDYEINMNYFNMLILFAILNKMKTGIIIIYKSNDLDYIIPWAEDIYKYYSEFENIFEGSHIYISFNEIIEYLGFDKIIKNKNIFSDKKLEILRQLNEKNLKSMTIFLDSESELKGTRSILSFDRKLTQIEREVKYKQDTITEYTSKNNRVNKVERNSKL